MQEFLKMIGHGLYNFSATERSILKGFFKAKFAIFMDNNNMDIL